MSRPRRTTAMLIPALAVATLVGCGGQTETGYGDETVQGFEGVKISGDFGTAPKLEWKDVIEYPDEIKTRTLIEGDGAEIEKGNAVMGSYWVGNGTTLEKEWSLSSEQLSGSPSSAFSAADGPVYEAALEDAQVGDRIEVVAPSEDFVGQYGNPEYGIGTRDTLVLVFDIKRNASPVDVGADALPKVQTDGSGKPTGLDFSGVKKPATDGQLKRHVLSEGKGEKLTPSMSVKARYYGMTFQGDKPFDENWSKKGADFSLQSVIPGWTYGLEGLKAGSKVLLEVPPEMAYGAKGSPPMIGPNATLWFVVEVLSAQEGQSQQAPQGQPGM